MGKRSTSDPFYQELGRALKEARVQSGHTHSTAAASAGLSNSNAIGRYESATRTPDIKTLAALTHAYSVDTNSVIIQAQDAAAQIKKGNYGKRQEEE
jgi:transcriptional regulator with XRE-family HTH domain